MKKPLPDNIANMDHHTSLLHEVIEDAFEQLEGGSDSQLNAAKTYINYRFKLADKAEVEAAFKNASPGNPKEFRKAIILVSEVAIEKQTHVAHLLKLERKRKTESLAER